MDPSKKIPLTLSALLDEALIFLEQESGRPNPSLYGVTDGKAVGTYIEHKFREHLEQRYKLVASSSAHGIDFPELGVDLKVTSARRPQSSCPFRSARQKIYGLGYGLLIFVYEKFDDLTTQTARLDIQHAIFVEAQRTADYQTTTGLLKILENDGNIDDVIAFLYERRLPVEEIQAQQLAEEILSRPPLVGYLTISNALQWRLQYRRAIDLAGHAEGVLKIR